MGDVEILALGSALGALVYLALDTIRRGIRDLRGVRVKINRHVNRPARCRVWVRGRLVFDGQSLDAAIAQLERETSDD